jgi:alkaline phosphatase
MSYTLFAFTETSADADGYEEIPYDGKPYLTLAYANGPGWMVHRNYSLRADLREWDDSMQISMGECSLVFTCNCQLVSVVPSTDNINALQDAGVPMYSETHGGEEVAVYARGPMAFLLSGTYEQSYIPHVMKYAACIGDNTDHCGYTDSASAISYSAITFVIAAIATLYSSL